MAYTKTNWENLPNTTTPVNATNLNKIENELANKNSICVGLSANYTISTTGNNSIPFNNILFQLGNKLSLENGKIKIGSGVNAINVSAQVAINAAESRDTGAFNVTILKNNSEMRESLNSGINNLFNVTKNIPASAINVSENDLISLDSYLAKNDVISSYTGRTFLNVEVIN